MVLIHVKQCQDRQFLYECPASQSVDTVIRNVALLNNLQLRISILVREGEGLRLHGPSKLNPDNDNEEDSDDDDLDGGTGAIDKPECSHRAHGPFYCKDPSGKRTGEACDPTVGEALRKALAEAELCASKDQVLHKMPLVPGLLKEAIRNVRGAVMMCYPMGLPNVDPVHQLINGTYSDGDLMDPDTAQMWWAGKELLREKRLFDHVGKNEKTKIVAKLQVQRRPPPPREPAVDGETQKEMMSWYYKKQQEHKKLEEDEDDSYANSSWSDPKALRRHFQGTSCIRFR